MARTVEAFGRLNIAFNNTGVENEAVPVHTIALADGIALLASI